MPVRRLSTRVPCPDGLSMGLDLYVPEAARGALPVVVVCHGFKGFKDWGLFPPLAERLAANGRAMALFDFSHNGIGDRPGEFDRLDLFERQTVSRHVRDLGSVLDFLDAGPFAEQAGLQRNHRFNVVGHSLGGAVAVLRAAEDDRVVQVATLNGLARLKRFGPAQLDELRRTGRVMIRNSRTGQELPLGPDWFADVKRLDLEEAATQVFVPALIVQAVQDESVSAEEGRLVNAWLAGSRLVEIEGTGHTFGAVHPFAGWTPALERVARELDAFLPYLGRLGGI